MKADTVSSGPGANGHSKEHAESALMHEFHAVLTDVEDLVKSTSSLTGEDLARAKAKLGARLSAAKESVRKFSDETVEHARHTAKVTDTYVHVHAWQAVGVAAVLGMATGYFLARRR